MRVFWFGIVVQRVPDNVAEGIVLSEGLPESEELDLEFLRYLILVRVCADSAEDGERIGVATMETSAPVSVHLISDDVDRVVRKERRLAKSLSENDVSIKLSFIGFCRESDEAQSTAIEILRDAVLRSLWQFWR